MLQISTQEGLRVIDAYRRAASQLYIRGSVSGERAWSSATIAASSATGDHVCFHLFDSDPTCRTLCRISLAGSKIWFDSTASKSWEDRSGIWRSSLLIKYPDGTEILLGERFPWPTANTN